MGGSIKWTLKQCGFWVWMKFIWYTEVGVVGGLNEEIGGIYEMWAFLTS